MRTDNYAKHFALLCFLNLGYLLVRAQQNWQYVDSNNENTVYSFQCNRQVNSNPTDCMSSWQQQIYSACNLTSIIAPGAAQIVKLGSYYESFKSATADGSAYTEADTLQAYQNNSNQLSVNGRCITAFFNGLQKSDFMNQVPLIVIGGVIALVACAGLVQYMKNKNNAKQATVAGEKTALFNKDGAVNTAISDAVRQSADAGYAKLV